MKQPDGEAIRESRDEARARKTALVPVPPADFDIESQFNRDLAAANMWFSSRMGMALQCYEDAMLQDEDWRMKLNAAREVLAHIGAVSPLHKPSGTTMDPHGGQSFPDPREQNAIMGVLQSMASANEALVDNLLPIKRITESRYVSHSQASIAEPDAIAPMVIDVEATATED